MFVNLEKHDYHYDYYDYHYVLETAVVFIRGGRDSLEAVDL